MRVALWDTADPVGVVESTDEGFTILDPELNPLTGEAAAKVNNLLSTISTYYRSADNKLTNDEILKLLVDHGAGYWEAKEIPES